MTASVQDRDGRILPATHWASLVIYLFPDQAIDIWPWDLTPLTSRVLGSLTAQVGVGALMISRDRRWSAWKLIVQTFCVATALPAAWWGTTSRCCCSIAA